MLNEDGNATHSTFNIRHSTFAIPPSSFIIPSLPLAPRDHDLLQRRPVLLGRQANRRTRGAAAHAGRAAADLAAEVALHGHRLLDVVLLLAEERGDPREERPLRLLVDHEDVVVGTVALA